jgi:hypothetical protein
VEQGRSDLKLADPDSRARPESAKAVAACQAPDQAPVRETENQIGQLDHVSGVVDAEFGSFGP